VMLNPARLIRLQDPPRILSGVLHFAGKPRGLLIP
jgi:hypothetical protein